MTNVLPDAGKKLKADDVTALSDANLERAIAYLDDTIALLQAQYAAALNRATALLGGAIAAFLTGIVTVALGAINFGTKLAEDGIRASGWTVAVSVAIGGGIIFAWLGVSASYVLKNYGDMPLQRTQGLLERCLDNRRVLKAEQRHRDEMSRWKKLRQLF